MQARSGQTLSSIRIDPVAAYIHTAAALPHRFFAHHCQPIAAHIVICCDNRLSSVIGRCVSDHGAIRMKQALAAFVTLLVAMLPGSVALADGHGGGGYHGGGYHGGGHYSGWRHGGGHSGGWNGYWGISVGVPGGWGAWPYPYAYGIGYPYPYVYGAYPVPRVIESRVYIPEAAPEVYVSRQPAAPATSNYYWFYCEDPAGYHPYVQQCNRTWLLVVPQTGGAPQLVR